MARPFRTATVVAALGALTLGLSACTPSTGGATSEEKEAEEAAETTAESLCDYPVTVTDMSGEEVTIESADSVVVTDNRAFEVLRAWGVHPAAAPRTLMSPANEWADDESILDTGSHGEPNFDQVIAADPTLIISGYRYGDHSEKLQDAAPDAAFIDMDADLEPNEYVRQQVTLLGDSFCKQEEAEELLNEFDEAVAEAKDAYDPEMTVMGLVTSANEIRYANPSDGRGASIFFSLLDLTPALDEDGSSNHQGDDISLEAIGEAQPDFLLVMDRDAAVGDGEDVTPALELIESSKVLGEVPAVKNNAIYIMPADYYLTEDIFAYIEVLDGLKEAFEAQDETSKA